MDGSRSQLRAGGSQPPGSRAASGAATEPRPDATALAARGAESASIGRVSRPAATFAAVLVLVVVLSALAAIDAAPTARFWANLNWTIVAVLAFATGVIGTAHASARDRRARAWFTAGLGMYGLGQLMWDVQLLTGTAGEPALSDIGYLGAAVPFGVGLLVAAATIEPARRPALALDLCVVAASVSSVVLSLFGESAFAVSDSALTGLVILAYPMAYLTLAGAGIVVVLASRAYPRPSSTLLAGLAVTGLYWLVWAQLAVGSLPASSIPINHVFTIGFVLLGAGTATWRTMPAEARPTDQAAVALVPIVAVVVAIGSIFIGNAPRLDVTGAARVAGFAALALVLARQTMLLRERERARADLQVMGERLTAALDHLPGIAWTTDASLTLTSVRGASTAELGLVDLEGRRPDLAELFGREQFASLGDAHRQALDGVAQTLEVVAAGRILVMHLSPLTVDGRRRVGVVGVALDVTAERETLERTAQAERMESLGRLAGGIAHDFNNLLTAINGYAEMALLELPPDAPARADVGHIKDAGSRAAALTRQILAFARQAPSQSEPLDVAAVVHDLEPLLTRLVGEDVTLSVAMTASPLPVLADRAQIEQIVVNLAVNARDAMPRGGTLRIEGTIVPAVASLDGGALADDPLAGGAVAPAGDLTGQPSGLQGQRAGGDPPGAAPDAWVEIAVSDSGIGMDEATRSRIFEPFFTTKSKGTGLGLATVYGAVRSSGGTIDVESTPGRGSTFRVRLPRIDGKVLPPPAPQAETGGRGGGDSLRILLCDDDVPVRTLVLTVLRRAGYAVDVAADPHDALRLAGSAGPYDLLVSDVVMPGMSGIELAARLRDASPGLEIMLISGYADAALDDHALPEGARLLGKPFAPAELIAAIEALFDERRGRLPRG